MGAFSGLKKFKWTIVLCGIILAIAAFTSMLLPNIMSDIIDDGIGKTNMDFILSSGLLMLGLAIISMLCNILSARLIAKVVVRYAGDLKMRIFKKVNEMNFGQFSLIGPSKLLSRTMEDVQLLGDSVYFMLRIAVTLPVMFIGGILLSLSKDVMLSLIMVIFLPIMVVVVKLVGKKLFDLWNTADNYMDKQNQLMRERLSGIRVIRAFNREDTEHKRIEDATNAMADKLVSANIRSGILDPVALLLLNMTTVAIIYIGGIRLEPLGPFSAADVFAVVQFVSLIMNSVMMLSFAILFLPRVKVKLSRINQVLKADTLDKRVKEDIIFKGDVRLENVDFKYEDSEEYTLKNINIDIKSGESVAFIGGTGSGKSSAIRLIMGFYPPTTGKLCFDGVSTDKINPHTIRANLSCSLQRSTIFSETIRENILMGDPNATDEKILEVADIAEIKSFIEANPEKLDFKLDQGGSNLSGGQKQRMAIARAIIKPASIYIFDDSFSALDFLTESKLRTKLNSYIKGKTQIVSTQRISTAMSADKIYVFDKGEIVGEGTHSHLLETCSIYKEIYESQVGGDLNG